jgi:hypothetical protein
LTNVFLTAKRRKFSKNSMPNLFYVRNLLEMAGSVRSTNLIAAVQVRIAPD